MSSADTGLSHNHNRVPYDSDDQDGKESTAFVFGGFSFVLAYRQQLRERSQPSNMVRVSLGKIFPIGIFKF